MGARKDPRYVSDGQVFIAEVLDTKAVIKNLSVSGLCVESNDFLSVVPNSKYTVDFVPEKESNIEPFKLDIESKWVRTKKEHSESGFIIVIPPGTGTEDMLKQYLAFLAQHSKPLD
jgi:hypothetical protein